MHNPKQKLLYEIGWNGSVPGIQIAIFPGLLSKVQEVMGRMVTNRGESYAALKPGRYFDPDDGGWGYEGVLTTCKPLSGLPYPCFIAPIPLAEEKGRTASCPVAVTLCFLSKALEFVSAEATDVPGAPTITFSTEVGDDSRSGCPLWADLYPAALDRLRGGLSGDEKGQIIAAMGATWERLVGPYELGPWGIGLLSRGDEIHLNVPGNSTGLDPGNRGANYYSLAPHNVDHIAQQLALLAGIAQLASLIRS